MPEKNYTPEQIEAHAKAAIGYASALIILAIVFLIVAVGIWIIGHA